MKNLYETVKSVGKKAILPLALATIVGCSSGDGALPVNQQTANVLEKAVSEQISEYSAKVQEFSADAETAYESTIASFNESIKDGYFGVKEQKSVLRQSHNYLSSMNKANELGELIPGYETQKVDEGVQRLNSLINENINGIDIRRPSLEKELEKQYSGIEVESHKSDTEQVYDDLAKLSLIAAYLVSPIFLGIGLADKSSEAKEYKADAEKFESLYKEELRRGR